MRYLHTNVLTVIILKTSSSKCLFEISKEVIVTQQKVWTIRKMFQRSLSNFLQYLLRKYNCIGLNIVVQRKIMMENLHCLTVINSFYGMTFVKEIFAQNTLRVPKNSCKYFVCRKTGFAFFSTTCELKEHFSFTLYQHILTQSCNDASKFF